MFSQLTAAENLRVCRGEPDLAYELFPELAPLRHIRAGLLSGGEQQMLSLAMALSRKPVLLLVDELSLGLAPLVVYRLLGAVRAAANSGVGVLLVEQRVKQVLDVADRAYVMQRGILTHSGTSQEIAGRLDEIVDSYLS
jgi:branched-chain amino acid transport system ATP-binding protein